jgi:ESCRT-II complex subunit VPS25
MILWKTHAEWADTIYGWARGFGLNDSVLAVDDLSTSDDVEGTELEGLPREIIIPALKILEKKGLARLFKGATPGEEGVKFLSR